MPKHTRPGIPVNCECGKTLHVKNELAGKRGKCPACGRVLIVPKEAPPPLPATTGVAGGLAIKRDKGEVIGCLMLPVVGLVLAVLAEATFPGNRLVFFLVFVVPMAFFVGWVHLRGLRK